MPTPRDDGKGGESSTFTGKAHSAEQEQACGWGDQHVGQWPLPNQVRQQTPAATTRGAGGRGPAHPKGQITARVACKVHSVEQDRACGPGEMARGPRPSPHAQGALANQGRQREGGQSLPALACPKKPSASPPRRACPRTRSHDCGDARASVGGFIMGEADKIPALTGGGWQHNQARPQKPSASLSQAAY